MNRLLLVTLLLVSCTQKRDETIRLELKLKCLDEAMAATTGTAELISYQSMNGYLSHEDYLLSLTRSRFFYDRDVENCEK